MARSVVCCACQAGTQLWAMWKVICCISRLSLCCWDAPEFSLETGWLACIVWGYWDCFWWLSLFGIERASFWSISLIPISKYCSEQAFKSVANYTPSSPFYLFFLEWSTVKYCTPVWALWTRLPLFPRFNNINHLSDWDHMTLLECDALNLLCFISKLLCIGHWPAINQLKCLSALSIHLCFLCVCRELDLKQCTSD